MAKVNWTFQALENLDEIATFHSNTSPKYANYLVDKIFQQTEMLKTFPRVGRIVP
jgi:plasmid stabilization system protein ParE